MSQFQYAPAAIVLALSMASPAYAAQSEASQMFGNVPDAVHLAALTPGEMRETKGALSLFSAAIIGFGAAATYKVVTEVYSAALPKGTDASMADIGHALAAGFGAGLALTTVMTLTATQLPTGAPLHIAIPAQTIGLRIEAAPAQRQAVLAPNI